MVESVGVLGAASQFRDLALELEPGTSALERGTQTGTDEDLTAAGCVQAGGTVQPGTDVHDHGAPVAEGAPLPTTGGSIPTASLLVLGLAGLPSGALRRSRPF